MSKITEKPTCLLCGKPLRKRTHSMDLVLGEKLPRQYLDGKPIVGVISRKKSAIHQGEEHVSFWCGQWGGYGDNFFCGLNCGYRWAVMLVKTNEKQRPGYVAQFRDNMKKFQARQEG